MCSLPKTESEQVPAVYRYPPADLDIANVLPADVVHDAAFVNYLLFLDVEKGSTEYASGRLQALPAGPLLATKCGCNRRTNPIELACTSLTSDTSFVAVRAFTKGGVAAGDILTEAQLASDGCLTDWLYSDTSGRFGDGDYEWLKKFINDHSAVSADESDPSTSADATSMVAPWTELPSRSSPDHYYSVAWNYSLSGTARVTASPPSTDETVLMIGLERPDSRSRSVCLVFCLATLCVLGLPWVRRPGVEAMA